MFRLLFFLLFIALSNILFGQSILDSKSKVSVQQSSLKDILLEIEEKHNVYFSYSPEVINIQDQITIPNKTLKLSGLFTLIFDPNYIGYEIVDEKIILFSTKENIKTISGVIMDSNTKESLPAATIIVDEGARFGYANLDGFYSIQVSESDSITLQISSIGYRAKIIKVSSFENPFNIELEYINTLDSIIITPFKDSTINFVDPNLFNPEKPGKKITREDIEISSSVFGKSDILNAIKMMPEVPSGFEGQNGYVSRGGTMDQNLVLLDGIPIYEVSHMGGMASVFMTETIKDVEFINSGTPSRFGGRLSSVLNVRSIDGSREDYYRQINVGLEGISLHLNGPIIPDKTSFTFSGRNSWFAQLSKPIVKSFSDFENYDLNYNDYYGKMTHWFNDSNSISISAYKGSDEMKFLQDNDFMINDSTNINVNSLTSLNWGNELLIANWRKAFGNKVFMNARLGSSNFFYDSQGVFDLKNETDTLISDQSISTSIDDDIASIDFDIYTQKYGTLNLGAGYTAHKYGHRIFESVSPPDSIVNYESTYNTAEYYFFIEDRIKMSRKWNLIIGARYSNYKTENTTYRNLEPRACLSFADKHHFVKIGLSRMVQYNHLLSNPGPGLPSYLWVPSTDEVGPQSLIEASLNYKLIIDGSFEIGLGGYYRRFNSLIHYFNTSDIFYFLILEQNYNSLPNNVVWENSITEGSGTARGLELNLKKSWAKWKINLAYALNKSDRKFENVIENQAFPYQFDRRHDFSGTLSHKLSDHASILIHYAYGTGHPYTLANEVFEDFQGNKFLNTNVRNNVRFEDFHHLDLQYRYVKKIKDAQIDARIGVYNVYNRQNPFYVYIFNDVAEQRQVSIFPILPQINFSVIW